MELNKLCQIVLVFAAVLAVSVAPPPPGFYTFDGRKLHPIGRPVQRRSGNEPSFVSGWKLPTFSKPSFLAALTEQREDNDDDEEGGLPTVSAAHLLPDYLTHQEFLKPQLQAAGFSGGRIIAGPFPVPLAALPKPPPRSGSNGPISSSAVTGGAAASPVALAPPPPPPQEAKQAPTSGRPYKPVQFPAVASQPIPIVKKPINKSTPPLSPPPPPPTTTTPLPVTLQTSRLTYPLPPASLAASAPAPWYAAHQSGPERLASSLGQASYNAAASHPQEGTRVTYGGWTPIYSASYANVQQQQYPASSDFTDGVQREPFLQDVVPQAEQELESLPSKSKSVVSSSSESQVVVGEPDIPSSLSTLTQEEEETSSIKKKRTVRKRKSKQVSSSLSSYPRRRSSSLKRRTDQQQQKPAEEQAKASPAASSNDNAEVADLSTASASSSSFTHISSPTADMEAPIVVVVAESPEPLVSTARGQGRFIGRVLPATVFDEDDLNHMMIRLPTSRFHQPIDPYY